MLATTGPVTEVERPCQGVQNVLKQPNNAPAQLAHMGGSKELWPFGKGHLKGAGQTGAVTAACGG